MNGYVARRRGRFYAVTYEGRDPVTGKETDGGTRQSDACGSTDAVEPHGRRCQPRRQAPRSRS